MKQKTFLMLKPDAFASGNAEMILNDIKEHGIQIEKSVLLTVNMDIMKTLLEHYQGVIDDMPKTFDFPGKLFNSFYYEGPHHIMPMMVSYDGDEDIIKLTRAMAGKTNPKEAGKESLRGKYSNDDYDQATKEWRLVNNVIHASDSHESASRELMIWSQYLNL